MSGPEDRELREYLDGDSPLSRAYRQASQEQAPADLDEAILARAKAELRRKPSWNRALAPFALAASVLLGVNLAWNLYQVPAVPDGHTPSTSLERLAEVRRADRASADTAARQRTAEESRPSSVPALAARSKRAEMPSAATAESLSGMAADAAHDAGDPIAAIEGLIAYVEGLQGAVFIRNGGEHSPAEAGEHLRRKWRKAGATVKTADDFIRLCASRSSISGDAYTIRFADGSVRPAAEVLREKLQAP